MNFPQETFTTISPTKLRLLSRQVSAAGCFVLLAIVTLSGSTAFAQRPQKLPAADKVIDRYLKALGGKKRVAAIKDAETDWTINLNGQIVGVAKTQTRAPSSARSELTFGNGSIIAGANSSSAWVKGLDGELRTLTGADGGAAKLQALLDAGRLIDYKKASVAARVISAGDLGSEPAFIVEFSTRSGARLHYYFSQQSGLPTRVVDDARKTTFRFSDYKAVAGLMQPHEIRIKLPDGGEILLTLEKASYNRGLPATNFDPPAAAEALNVPELLRIVTRNQDQVEKRFHEYSFLQKEIDREISGKGEVKKETVRVSEVFPIANREPILKLISENGMLLSAERAAKEQKRVEEEFLKAERDRDKNEAREQKRRAERERKRAGKAEEDDDVEISQFLKVCEFVSPRHERFRDRDAVVFDFRPKPGFRPGNRQEDLISKLVGVVWIDPIDKQIIRLEARLAEGFKMGGGLLFSLRPGASMVMEQTRMNEGVWLPRLAQINLSMKVLLFGGGDLNKTYEWSDYKHFSGDVRDYNLDAPKSVEAEKKP